MSHASTRTSGTSLAASPTRSITRSNIRSLSQRRMNSAGLAMYPTT